MILVTGGTGFIGSHIVRWLVADQRPIRLLVRDPERVPDEIADRVEMFVGDVRLPETLTSPFRDVRQVIHLVGIIRETADSKFESMHTEATRHVIEAAQVAGARRLLHMSALGTRPNAASRYHQTKWAAEELVHESGLDWTIFRPSIIVGQPGDRDFIAQLIDMIRRDSVIKIPGDGTTRMQPISVDDLAACFLKALDDPATIGQTYELAGPEVMTIEEVYDLLAQAMQIHKPKIHTPFWLLRPAAAVMQAILPNPPITVDQAIMLEEDNVCDIAPMREALGIDPRSIRKETDARAREA
jgi:uncharacterized protein YbjT (DUF2867 family)